MSFFSDLGDIFTGVVSGGGSASSGTSSALGGGGWLPFLLSAGTSIYGAYSRSNANVERAKILSESKRRQAEAVRQGNIAAQKRYDEIMGLTKPGQSYLRDVVARNPYELTPQQQTQMADVRLRAANLPNGLRGSGRTQVAIFRNIEDATRGRMVAQNLNRSDTAAGRLSTQYASALGSSAALDTNTGRAVGNSLAEIGTVNAGVPTANTGERGAAIADIAGLIATDYKDRQRASKYKREVSNFTQRK